MVDGLRFRVDDFGFGVKGLGFMVFGVQGLWLMVWG